MNTTPHAASAGAIPTENELVMRARAMIPMLREGADAVEKARRVPDSTVTAYKEAGFFKILQPKRWGGWEMDPRVFSKVLMELGRGCPSSAWVMMILGLHQWEFGLFSPRAGDDVWAKDNTVLVASSYPPVGKYEKVDGGWKVSGRWPTSSGTDHADWAIIGGWETNAQGGRTDRLNMLVPRSDYTIDDDWHVFGLCGTGSKSLVIKEAFVPDHRVHSMVSHQPSDPAPCYKPHFTLMFFGGVASAINGMAQGAVDIFTEQMSVRRNTISGAVTSASPYVKDRLANAVAKVRSSRMRLLAVLGAAMEYAQRGEPVPLDEHVPALLDIARVGRECEEAVLLLYKATAARGIYLNNPLQRVLRDVLAGANHATQNADDLAGHLGGYLLGQPLPPLVYNR